MENYLKTLFLYNGLQELPGGWLFGPRRTCVYISSIFYFLLQICIVICMFVYVTQIQIISISYFSFYSFQKENSGFEGAAVV